MCVSRASIRLTNPKKQSWRCSDRDCEKAYEEYSVAGRECYDVRARHHLGARALEVGLYGVDDLVPSDGVEVGQRKLLAVVAVQKD